MTSKLKANTPVMKQFFEVKVQYSDNQDFSRKISSKIMPLIHNLPSTTHITGFLSIII